jgi:hypothetical protein
MKLSDLKNLFANPDSIESFKEIIKDEVDEYTSLLKKAGSSVPIYATQDAFLKVGHNDLIMLCKAYVDGTLGENYVNYIIDVLQLSEQVEFESEELVDIAAGLTDPEINGPLTHDEANKVINILTPL